MGYIHDVAMSQFVPPSMFLFTAGTWTGVSDTYIWSLARTAADASFWAYVPVPVPSNSVANKGSYLKSIEVFYSIGTAAVDDFATVTLCKDTLNAHGSAITTAAVTHTIDADHDTAAERLISAYHRMVVTLTTPAWIDHEENYHLDMLVDCAATSVFKFYGALVNYTLRL
jgi:hypothetical protein